MEKPTKGIAVDGFCKGNPGFGGYQGIDIATGKKLFSRGYGHCTNNIAEFIAIVHALGYAKLHKFDFEGYIYSDSEIAIAWVKSQKVSTGMDLDLGSVAWGEVQKCLRFLSQEKKLVEVKKWLTKEWGEIPADFGNKK